MRGMNRYYHERFFADVRFTTAGIVGLLLFGWWAIPEAFLLVPVIALVGANQTAFDASYLHFARHYAATLEDDLNATVRKSVLVGARLEDRYLYPLNKPKLVATAFGAHFSWFGWMTLLYTLLGILAFAAGVVLGWETLLGAGTGWAVFYLSSLGALTAASLIIGGWWFVGGAGERRLREVLGGEFGATNHRTR